MQIGSALPSLLTMSSQIKNLLPCLLLASCAATPPLQPDSIADRGNKLAASFGKPASGVTTGVLAKRKSDPSSWEYKINTVDGPWHVLIAYRGRSANDEFTAIITFPDKTKLALPAKAVSIACYAISEEPEVAIWAGAEGRHILSIGGTITATRSEGLFTFKGREFLGATVWEETLEPDHKPSQRNTRVFLPDGAQSHP